MIATIAKQFTFDAAHRLQTCPPDHKCFNLHGHTYTVEVVLAGPVQPNGFVVDYDQIAKAMGPILGIVDHHYLNDIPGLEVSSTENLAAWILRLLVDGATADLLAGPYVSSTPTTLVTKVRVMESSTTWCEVRTGDAGCKRMPWVCG